MGLLDYLPSKKLITVESGLGASLAFSGTTEINQKLYVNLKDYTNHAVVGVQFIINATVTSGRAEVYASIPDSVPSSTPFTVPATSKLSRAIYIYGTNTGYIMMTPDSLSNSDITITNSNTPWYLTFRWHGRGGGASDAGNIQVNVKVILMPI